MCGKCRAILLDMDVRPRKVDKLLRSMLRAAEKQHLLAVQMCRGLSWSAGDLMLLALLAVVTLLMPEMLEVGGTGWGELGEFREL